MRFDCTRLNHLKSVLFNHFCLLKWWFFFIQPNTFLFWCFFPRNPKQFHVSMLSSYIFFYLLKNFIYLFLERGKGREKERERNIDVWEKHWLPLAHTPTRDRTRNPGTCPDWELNRPPFTLQEDTQSTEPHRSGLLIHFKETSGRMG